MLTTQLDVLAPALVPGASSHGLQTRQGSEAVRWATRSSGRPPAREPDTLGSCVARAPGLSSSQGAGCALMPEPGAPRGAGDAGGSWRNPQTCPGWHGPRGRPASVPRTVRAPQVQQPLNKPSTEGLKYVTLSAFVTDF